jgi:hypothetical protein
MHSIRFLSQSLVVNGIQGIACRVRRAPGHFTCSFHQTFHVLTTLVDILLDIHEGNCYRVRISL